MPKLTPEQEIIASHMSAVTAALQVLVHRLEEKGLLAPGEYPEALTLYMEMAKGRQTDITLALLDDLVQALSR